MCHNTSTPSSSTVKDFNTKCSSQHLDCENGLFIDLKRKYLDNISDASKEMSGQIFSPTIKSQKKSPQEEKDGEGAEFVQPHSRIKRQKDMERKLEVNDPT